MPKVYGHDRDTAARLRRKSRKEYINANPPRAVLLPKTGGGGSPIRYYRLAEDVTGDGPFWARETNRMNEITGDWTRVYNWAGLITGAVAGYYGQFSLIEGTWDFTQGPCVIPCVTDGVLLVGEPPGATVGEDFSHTITSSGLGSLISVIGLPPGLTYDDPTISGSPTTPGTYYVTLSATAPSTDGYSSCTLTRVLVIVVGE